MYSRLAAPEPLVPTTAKRSPRHTVMETSWNSCVSPSWDFATSSSTSSGSPREASGFAAGGLVRLSVAPVLRAALVMMVAPLLCDRVLWLYVRLCVMMAASAA
jgi:hypothetical protein